MPRKQYHERITQPLVANNTNGARGASTSSPAFPSRYPTWSGRHDSRSTAPPRGTIVLDTYLARDSETSGNASTEEHASAGQHCCAPSLHTLHQSAEPPFSHAIHACAITIPTTPTAHAHTVVQYRSPHVPRVLHQSRVRSICEMPHSPEE